MPDKKIALQNLGCSKNIVDGEYIAAHLQRYGFTLTESVDSADIILVNTCTFIQEATQEAIDTILAMASYKTHGACSKLIVAGCFSERYRRTIQKKFPEVDLWVGVHTWMEELNRYFQTDSRNVSAQINRTLTGPVATQYLKIADGCSHGCAYCIIPSIRGNFQSRLPDAIIREAQWLSDQGVQECILVSQDTSFYGKDINSSLTALLETLLLKTDFHWIRMMYLHPRYISDDLLALVAAEKRICSYFDMPLQHIADPILAAMNRGSPDSATIYRLIERIRKTIPEATLRTTFILGFPGETDRHFRQLTEFVEWAHFDKLGVFPFSPEEGTRAAAFHPRPRTTTAQKRCETIMDVQKEISRKRCEARIGKTAEIIIDAISDDPDYSFVGRCQGDAPEIDGRVFLTDDSTSIGSFKNVRIFDANEYDLFAKIEPA